MSELNKNTPIEPGIEVDGGYAYCPICYYPDLEPNNITTKCPSCSQLINWSWMNKFKDE